MLLSSHLPLVSNCQRAGVNRLECRMEQGRRQMDRMQTGRRVHKIDELEDMYRIVCCVTVQLLNICTCNLSKYIQYIHTTHNTETEVLQRSRESKKSRKIHSQFSLVTGARFCKVSTNMGPSFLGEIQGSVPVCLWLCFQI